jgi:glucokinase
MTSSPPSSPQGGPYRAVAPDVVADFLKMHGDQVPVTRALLAVAGPVEGEQCKLTNCPWIIDGELGTKF